MSLFGPPNIGKLKANRDFDGLGRVLTTYQKSGAVRQAAAEALGELRDAKGLDPLGSALRVENDAEVRAAAVRAMRRIGGQAALASLVDLLASSRAQSAAADALVEIGEPALGVLVPKLVQAVRDKLGAEKILVQLENVKPLADRLRGCGSEETARVLKSVSANVGGGLSVEKIQEAVSVYQMAVDGGRDSDAKIERGLAVLRRIGSLDALLTLLGFMSLKTDNPVVSMSLASTASRELERCEGRWPAPVLIEALKSPSAPARRMAAARLREKEEPGAKALLISALEDPDDLLRREAARAIGTWKYQEALQPLLRILKNSQGQYDTRTAAAEALMELGDPQAVQPLLDGWREANGVSEAFRFRVAVIRALGEIGDPRAVQPLRDAFSSELYGEERGAIPRALAKIRHPQAIEALADVLLSTSSELVKIALDALKPFGRDAVPALLRRLELGRPAVAEALEQAGWTPSDNTVGAIFWINKEDWGRCEALGEPAIRPLIDRLAMKGDLQPVVRTLGRLGEARAVEPLIQMLEHRSKDVRREAAGALLELYRRDKIDAARKQLILANRDKFLAGHVDSSGHVDQGGSSHSDCPSDHHEDGPTHDDRGIGFSFDI